MNEVETRRLSKLKTFLAAFKYTDRRSINNGFFVGQCISKLPQVYNDFKGFGRLGVSSFILNWDYSNLRINFKEDTSLRLSAKESSNFKKVAGVLSQYSSDELQLVSLSCFDNGNLLNPLEKNSAMKIKEGLTKKL